jgi:hypothetical protein
MHNAADHQAPNLPDSTLDRSSARSIVEREQIGPNRYIADLGILFDRARAANCSASAARSSARRRCC